VAEEEKQESQPKKKSGKLKWILMLVILLLLGGGGYYAYTKFFTSTDNATQAEQAAQEEAEKGPQDTQLVTLPTFLVNLADPLGRRYLKLTMDVEVEGEKTVEKLNQNMAKVRDAIILLLSSKTYADLSTLENKQLLKMEIVNQLNLILETSNILRVYFTEMVIQ